MNSNAIAPLSLVSAALLYLGCSLAPPPELPDPAREMPADFEETPAAVTVGAHVPLQWWKAFADPALDRIVDSVLDSNLDMAAAVARVEQARERARIARAAIRPVVAAGAGINDLTNPTNTGFGAQIQELGLERLAPGFTLPERLAITTWSLSADFSYEMDFWGRASSSALAAGAEYLASESDYQTARIGILAETIGAYFEVVDFRRRIAISRRMVDVLLEREDVASTRYDRGLADSSVLYRIRQDLRNTQAIQPQLENGLANAEGRLAVLLGGYRNDLAELLPEPLAPETAADPVPPGIPADLLMQRPDVRAARHRLEAARFQVDARRAELLPTLSFSGSIGLQSSKVDSLFKVDQWFTNLASNLLAPVFQGGRLRSNVALAEARFGELAATYGRTVVTAVNEVETALAVHGNEGRRHALLASRLEEARATERLRSQRYEAGIGGYADFLDALLTRLNVESALAGAERDLALSRLTVHRALGGAWTPEASAGEAPPAQASPQPAPQTE
ncbi:MAG: efflux transporter outer membrane subunit [Acidobacteria bacterium]|nr:efflux transporter outer membrane subunit [Acidobacteriota bacterium]